MAAVVCRRGLATVARGKRAFRCLKTVDLKIRPIYHRLSDRVRAHVFLCMLAYYVEWHLRRKWAPLIFDDEELEQAATGRRWPVAPAEPSASAQKKARTKRTRDGLPAQSFQGLLAELGTLTSNQVQLASAKEAQPFWMQSRPTPLQARAFELLGISPTQPGASP